MYEILLKINKNSPTTKSLETFQPRNEICFPCNKHDCLIVGRSKTLAHIK